jgi:tetratricopeptide (TPR) repeat protein
VSRHPTDLVPRALLALRNKRAMNQFVEEAREYVGEDDFEMLEASLVFAETGLVEEAGRLLTAFFVEAVPEAERSGLPLYYLAYLSSLRDDVGAARDYLERAARVDRDREFPSRPESLEVLRYAVRERPGDARAHLHIGNLYAHLGRIGEARDHWEKAVKVDSSLSIAHRNLALHAWSVEEDLSKAERAYRAAMKARPKDQTLYRDLAEVLLAQERRREAIAVLERTPFETLRRADIIIMLTQAYCDERQYGKAIDLLESTPYFVNWEGQTITWNLFHKAHIERGRERFERREYGAALEDFEAALTYPENIGVGRSNEPKEATAQYWRGKALEALGRLDAARSAWELGAAGVEGSGDQRKSRQLCREALEETK